jgi:hypothetical protein
MINPSISRRISIRFLPSPPSEPTNTLVLTAGIPTSSQCSNFFVDFRPLSASPSECEWAFAGYKVQPHPNKSRWIHLIDSRGAEWEGEHGIEDSGVFETLPNGDELERGEMLNPVSGKVGPYEEVWRDEPLPPNLQVTVALTETDGGVKGVVVRMGQWLQGILRISPDEVVASRYWWAAGDWALRANYGAPHYPDTIPTNALEGRATGDQFTHGGRLWTVALTYLHL